MLRLSFFYLALFDYILVFLCFVTMADKHNRPVAGPVPLRPQAPNAHRQTIEEAGARLQAVGVPAAYFQANTYVAFGYTEAVLAGLLRVFADDGFDEKLESILQLGVSNHLFATVRGMSADAFYRFLHFLRSPDGQNALAEIAWIAMFEAQRSDLANSVDEARRRHDALIADLERQLRGARAAMETALIEARLRYYAVGTYQPMTSRELNRACWDEYNRAAVAAGYEAAALTEPLLIEAVHAFGDVVRKRHILEFLEDGDRQQSLDMYLNQKIGELTAVHDERAAKRLRGLLEIAGTEAVVPTPPPVKGGIVPENAQTNVVQGAGDPSVQRGGRKGNPSRPL